MDEEEIEEKLNDCLYVLEDEDCPFTEWEKEFVESLQEHYMENGNLTEKQQDSLQIIWEKTCE